MWGMNSDEQGQNPQNSGDNAARAGWGVPQGGQNAAAQGSTSSTNAQAAGAAWVGAEATSGTSGVAVADSGSDTQRQPRRVGLGTALCLMLVAAVAAGSITGTVVGSNSSTVTHTLEQPSVAGSGGDSVEGDVEQVAAHVLPAVVSISVTSMQESVEGSGSIISSDGYVLTNSHVVADAEDGRAEMQVTLNDGTVHEAEYVAGDTATDIAVIKIQGVSDLPTLQFGDSDNLQVGQEVVAVGSPLGLSATVTTGIVSALNRPVRASDGGGESSLIDAVQTDAAINPGNSGGPLVDMEGNIIGMNSVIASLSETDSSQSGSIGLGFAIPSNFAKRVAQQLMETGEVSFPMLGVRVNALQQDTTTNGAEIVSVDEGTPAAEAGLQAGDVITKLDDRLIDTADALIAAVRGHEFGDTVTLEVTHRGSSTSEEVEVTLTSE